MKTFTVDLETLLTVVAAVLDEDGALVGANAGFLRLFPAAHAPRLGTNVARFFVQPGFAALRDLVAARDGYRGMLTLGESTGRMRTLRGRAWQSGTQIRVLAEYDIADLERHNDAMLDLSHEASVAQQTLARANVALKQREVRIVEESLTDALTGIGNRRKLEQALTQEIGRARRNAEPLSAIMADIDYFKRVNDEFGHGVGDKVLAGFGALLKRLTRMTDVVARFGGEEFIVLMPHTDLAKAMAKAEQLRGALAAQATDPMDRPVTSSFGVVELEAGEEPDSLLARLDTALYEAKAGGRNRVVPGRPYVRLRTDPETGFPHSGASTPEVPP